MSMSNRVCQRCGNPLVSGEVYCSNCGARYLEPGAVEPTQRASSSYPDVSSPGQLPFEPTQYAGSPYDNPPYGAPSTSYGSPGSNYTPPPAPTYAPSPPSNVPFGGAYGQQPPGQYGGVPGIYGQQPGQYGAGYPQPPQPKKGPNIGLILGVVVLLVLLIGGGLFLLTRPKGGTTNNGNSTPGVTGNATPTPLFSDNFANNSKGWATGNDNGFSRNITNNALILVENNQNHILPEPLPTNSTFSDFTVTATFTFDHGDQNDSVGIYMRGDSTLDHDYRVDINGNNTYAIAREYIASDNTPAQHFIVTATSSSAIKSIGQQNTVTAIMKGSQLVLLINGTKVNSISDTNYASGQVAVYVAHGDTSQGTQASFTSVAVYPAPSQLP